MKIFFDSYGSCLLLASKERFMDKFIITVVVILQVIALILGLYISLK